MSMPSFPGIWMSQKNYIKMLMLRTLNRIIDTVEGRYLRAIAIQYLRKYCGL